MLTYDIMKVFGGGCKIWALRWWLEVYVEVKVVNMEVKPPFVCFTIGRFVDNGLQAHRVTHKKGHTDREMFRSGLSNKFQNAK